MVLNMWN